MTDSVKRIGTLDDLQPALLNVEVELEGGDIAVFQMKLPTFSEMLRIERDIPIPEGEITGVDPVTKRPMRDYSSPAYLARVAEAQNHRYSIQLVRSLQLDIPGGTEQDKAEWLRNRVGAKQMRQLTALIRQVFLSGEARIEDRANTFHPNGNSGVADNGTTEDDADGVG